MNRLDFHHDRSHIRQYRPSEWRTYLERQEFQVESIELYTISRPLTSLTKDVVEEDQHAIHALLENLSEEEQSKLGFIDCGGEPHINHWYVLVAAVSPGASARV